MAHDMDMSGEDAEALRVRRAELYAFMQEITAAALMLPQPETYIEAERAVRTITTADRLIQQFDLPKPDEAEKSPTPAPKPTLASMRKGLRMLADRMMAAAKTIPLPENALTALHALRYARAYDRMLTQLYASPKPKPAVTVAAPPRYRAEIEAEIHALAADMKRKVAPIVAQMKEDARKSGFWYDGRPYIPEPEPERREPPNPETTDLNSRPEISKRQDDKPHGQRPDPPDPP